MHSYAVPDEHEALREGLEPKLLLKFLSRVEDVLLEHALL